MNAPLYTTEILRLAASLPEPRGLDRVDGAADERSPTCGSTLRVEVQLDDGGRVRAISQTVHACAFGQASAALMAASAAGKSRDEVREALDDLTNWLAGKSDEPGSWLGLQTLAPARSRKSRHGAILLPFRALASAMERAGG
ncbi:iron-sulfur cluster assembly scaffold protein [Sphingomonas sp. SM33]|uniref:Iron-sulfur cluster assembly scaffold protein n=1 Tax=Sphingomonas telluris TaxID=2907998 RepID=A0ABS9VNM6_9SPHN|nr:iron-sulfur cluster assembly scaffold protein [Sphingomonas telluris]MCH8615992.1 iron-sulfur cluster assembly scaffold protein [Sphingomonas telluris]